MYDNGDILLFVLSAWRQTPWRDFKRCFDEIQRKSATASSYDAAQTATSHRWRALRDLSTLGHIDLQLGPGDIRVFAAPPVLVRLPTLGNLKAVLCGARSPNFLEDIQSASVDSRVELVIESQSDISPFAPSRVELQAEDEILLETVADGVGIRYLSTPSARILAQVSVSLPEYLQSLEWSDAPELNWRCEDFDTQRLRFRPPGATRPDRRLSRYQDPATTIWRYHLWQDGQFAAVDLDWGRYTILAMTAQGVLRYEPENQQAFVPSGAPLPTLLARALGLCNGRCPASTPGVHPNPTGRYRKFTDVPPSIFRTVADKVEQQAFRNRWNQ